MQNDIQGFVHKKLSVRVSLWVVLFAAVIFLAALSFLFVQSRTAVRQEAISHATEILDKTSLRVTGILNRVEVASKMTEWLVNRHIDDPESMLLYSRSMLENNPDFSSCSIAFEPYYFKEYGRYFSAYTRYDADTLRTSQGGSDAYQYFYMDWYLMPKLLDRATWTEPYMELDAASGHQEMVTSYSRPILNSKGDYVGTLNTGLSLNWLSQTISAVKPYPHSYSVMIGKGGTYFVHPDEKKLLKQTIFTPIMEKPDSALDSLGHAMQRGEEGMTELSVDGQHCYVFYKPLGVTGWSMAIVCPESDIFQGFTRLRTTALIIVAVGLLLMLFFFIRIITRELQPLRRLADEAETIASGQFQTQLPDFGRIDEIDAFNSSLESLKSFYKNSLELAVSAKKIATKNLEVELETKTRIISDQQQKVDELNLRIENLQNTVNDSNEEKLALQKELDRVNALIIDKDALIQSLKNSLAAVDAVEALKEAAGILKEMKKEKNV